MKRYLLLLSVILLLGGCGAKKEAPAEDTSAALESVEETVSETAEEDGEEKEDPSEKFAFGRTSQPASPAERSVPGSSAGGNGQASGNADDYIFPESNAYPIGVWEVSGLSKELCNLGKNEIYARHGRKFKKEEIRKYFESKSWYKGTIPADQFDDTILNLYEQRNARFLLWAEEEFALGVDEKDAKEYTFIGVVDSTSEIHKADANEKNDRIRITKPDDGSGTLKAVYNGKCGNEWSERSGEEISFTLSDGGEYQCDEEFYYDVSLSRNDGMLIVYEDGADCFWLYSAK